jgi:hypothetical protein
VGEGRATVTEYDALRMRRGKFVLLHSSTRSIVYIVTRISRNVYELDEYEIGETACGARVHHRRHLLPSARDDPRAFSLTTVHLTLRLGVLEVRDTTDEELENPWAHWRTSL